MHLIINGKKGFVSVTEESTFVSRSTGRELRRLTVELLVRGDDGSAEVNDALPNGAAVNLVADEETGSETSFTVTRHGYCYSDASADRTHSIGLEEREELRASEVVIGGINIVPYHYREEVQDEYLHIQLRALIEPGIQDELLAVELQDEPFEVTRVGISERSETMRFGRMLWSRDGEMVRQEVNLIEAAQDETRGVSGFVHLIEPFRARAEEMIVSQGMQLEHLVDALVESGTISAEQAEAVRTVPDEESELRMREFSRTRDLDEFLGEDEDDD